MIDSYILQEVLPPKEYSFFHIDIKTDVGVYQRTSVEIDFEKTVEELTKHWDEMPSKVEFVAKELMRIANEVGREKYVCVLLQHISC